MRFLGILAFVLCGPAGAATINFGGGYFRDDGAQIIFQSGGDCCESLAGANEYVDDGILMQSNSGHLDENIGVSNDAGGLVMGRGATVVDFSLLSGGAFDAVSFVAGDDYAAFNTWFIEYPGDNPGQPDPTAYIKPCMDICKFMHATGYAGGQMVAEQYFFGLFGDVLQFSDEFRGIDKLVFDLGWPEVDESRLLPGEYIHVGNETWTGIQSITLQPVPLPASALLLAGGLGLLGLSRRSGQQTRA